MWCAHANFQWVDVPYCFGCGIAQADTGETYPANRMTEAEYIEAMRPANEALFKAYLNEVKKGK